MHLADHLYVNDRKAYNKLPKEVRDYHGVYRTALAKAKSGPYDPEAKSIHDRRIDAMGKAKEAAAANYAQAAIDDETFGETTRVPPEYQDAKVIQKAKAGVTEEQKRKARASSSAATSRDGDVNAADGLGSGNENAGPLINIGDDFSDDLGLSGDKPGAENKGVKVASADGNDVMRTVSTDQSGDDEPEQLAQAPQAQQGSNQQKGSFQRYRNNLAIREGGLANRPIKDDPGGLTNQGISQDYLNDLRQDPNWKQLPATPDKLTTAQIDSIYEKQFYRLPKIDKLEQVPGLAQSSPQLSEQIFDSGVQHGPKDAGTWLQKAIHQEMGIDLRVKDPKTGKMVYDGNIGPATRQALGTAVQSGKAKDINNAIVQMRLAHMQKQPNYAANKNGWERRARSFQQP